MKIVLLWATAGSSHLLCPVYYLPRESWCFLEGPLGWSTSVAQGCSRFRYQHIFADDARVWYKVNCLCSSSLSILFRTRPTLHPSRSLCLNFLISLSALLSAVVQRLLLKIWGTVLYLANPKNTFYPGILWPVKIIGKNHSAVVLKEGLGLMVCHLLR